jgi:hypothetical protein
MVMRALEKDPSRRYASAAAMMEDSQSILTALQSGPFGRQGAPGHAPAGAPGAFPPEPGRAPEVQTALAHPSPVQRGGVMGQRPPLPHQPVPAGQAGSLGGGAASMPTVLDRPNPLFGGAGGRPHDAFAAAAARTILVSPGHGSPPAGPHGHGPGHSPRPYPHGGGGGPPADLRTMMIANSEGIVSMARELRPGPVPDSRGGPMVGPAYGSSGGTGASALFWILCLLTGLAVGIGAYWLVLEFGK